MNRDNRTRRSPCYSYVTLCNVRYAKNLFLNWVTVLFGWRRNQMLDKILKFLNYLSMILMISTRSQQDTGSFSRLGDKIRGKLNLWSLPRANVPRYHARYQPKNFRLFLMGLRIVSFMALRFICPHLTFLSWICPWPCTFCLNLEFLLIFPVFQLSKNNSFRALKIPNWFKA